MSSLLFRTFLAMLIGISAFAKTNAQDCCAPETVYDICYLSSADFCFSNRSQCTEYSLDGKFMKNALAKKLTSPQLFGPDGISKRIFNLKKVEELTTIASIDSCGCDIFFMPAVFIDTVSGFEDHDRSFLPRRILDTVHAWSTVCPTNVVIASQGEARRWGYSLSDQNQNPNRPVTNQSISGLFNGPFGMPESFDQGGSYQGVFTQVPATGASILARDDRGRPTIAFDRATGDLITGDIGFFCNQVGPISGSDSLANESDLLICNFFELAGRLAESTRYTEQTFEICDNQPIVLPSGEMTNSLGVYVDTLIAFNGCDSVVRTELIECIIVKTPNIFSPNGDGINDFFNLIGAEKVEISDFKIFNRWGQLIYNNDTPETGWNGKFRGEEAPSDVYIFRIAFKHSLGTKEEVMTGDVTLYR